MLKPQAQVTKREDAVSTEIPEKFCSHRRQIQALRISNRQFSDLWSDYCEVLDSLAPVEDQSIELGRLRDELEIEIHEVLEKSGSNGPGSLIK